MKLNKSNLKVYIRMTDTRTKTYNNVNNGQPVVVAYFQVGIAAEVVYEEGEEKNGEWKTVNNTKFSLMFRNEEETKAAAETLRENAKPMFLALYKKEGKVTMKQLVEMTNAL